VSFPSYEKWVQDVLNPRDRVGGQGPYCFETEVWYQAYRNKHRITQALLPRSVLEIGIRYGYAAHAFLLSSHVDVYIGVDIDDPVINAMGEKTCGWALGMLERTTAKGIRITHHTVNTRTTDIRTLIQGTVDFTHIDADHTFTGALDDISKAWDLTRHAVLVDDYLGSPPVHDAVDAFVAQSGALLLQTPSGTGEALLLK
jgi:hypothetical protein